MQNIYINRNQNQYIENLLLSNRISKPAYFYWKNFIEFVDFKIPNDEDYVKYLRYLMHTKKDPNTIIRYYNSLCVSHKKIFEISPRKCVIKFSKTHEEIENLKNKIREKNDKIEIQNPLRLKNENEKMKQLKINDDDSTKIEIEERKPLKITDTDDEIKIYKMIGENVKQLIELNTTNMDDEKETHKKVKIVVIQMN